MAGRNGLTDGWRGLATGLAVWVGIAGCGVGLFPPAYAEEIGVSNLVPWPRSVKSAAGAMVLGPGGRIVVANPGLKNLGVVLAGELRAVTGVALPVIQGGRAVAGDIVLELDASLTGEAYRLSIGDTAMVHGGNYGAVALGTVTLLQSVVHDGSVTALPHGTIEDAPRAGYRGLLIDVARKPHSIPNLKQIVELCRLYKVRYLQLHLTDDPLFMFPSEAYPAMGSKNFGAKPYTLEQLKDLVAYADARDVTIIPEYEVPGHSAAAIRSYPDLFKIHGTKPYEHHASINFAKPEVMKAVGTIVGEMCEVFKSSPYFHVGGDEADLALAMQNADFQAAAKRLDLPNQHELYRHFLVQMDGIVKSHGKQMIVWEGFGPRGKVGIPKDVIVMAYEIRFYKPDALLKDGYRVVNASWVPLYVVNKHVRPPQEIYNWKLEQFKPFGAKAEAPGTVVAPSERLIGAQMCAWEQGESQELPSLRGRVPAMAERIWNPDAGRDFADFHRRFDATNKLLDALVSPTK